MAASELSRGRQAYTENAWSRAYELLRCGDQEQTVSAQDLELLARAAYMLGATRSTHTLWNVPTVPTSRLGTSPQQHAVPGGSATATSSVASLR